MLKAKAVHDINLLVQFTLSDFNCALLGTVVLLCCTEWGIKISHISRGHCAGSSGDREVG
jgi:hypothetical protein